MRDDAIRAVAYLAAAYPASKFDNDATAAVWIECLEDLDGKALEVAVRALVLKRNSSFAPSIGEIRGQALGIPADAEVDAVAAEAWMKLRKLVQDVGGYGVPDFGGDLVLERAAQMLGGWRDFCRCNDDDMPSHRARLVDAYRSARKAADGLSMLPSTLRALVEGQRARFLGLPESTPPMPLRTLVDSVEWERGS